MNKENIKDIIDNQIHEAESDLIESMNDINTDKQLLFFLAMRTIAKMEVKMAIIERACRELEGMKCH